MWLISNTSPGGASKPSFCHPSDLPLLILFFTVDCNSVFICICELPAKHKLFIFIMGQTWHKVDAQNTGYLAEWRLDERMKSLEMKCYKSPAWKKTFNEWHFFPLQGWATLVLLSFFFFKWFEKKIYSHLVLFTEEMAKQVQKLYIWHSHMQRSLWMSASGLPKPVFTLLLCD